MWTTKKTTTVTKVTTIQATTIQATTVDGKTTTTETTSTHEGELDLTELEAAMAEFSAVGDRMSADFARAVKRVSDAAKNLHKPAPPPSGNGEKT